MMGKSGFSVDVDFYETLIFRSTMLPDIFMGLVGGKLTKGSIAGGVPDIFLLIPIGYLLGRDRLTA